MTKQNKAHDEGFNDSLNSTKDNAFFYDKSVDGGCEHPLKIIFETLLLQKKSKQQDLADYLGVDKAYVSRMVHGLQIPPLRIRLKVAKFFQIDSSLIWRYQDLPYIKKLSEVKRNFPLSQTFSDRNSDVYREEFELNKKRKFEGF